MEKIKIKACVVFAATVGTAGVLPLPNLQGVLPQLFTI